MHGKKGITRGQLKKVQSTNTETNEKEKGYWHSKRLQISKSYQSSILSILSLVMFSNTLFQKISTYPWAQFRGNSAKPHSRINPVTGSKIVIEFSKKLNLFFRIETLIRSPRVWICANFNLNRWKFKLCLLLSVFKLVKKILEVGDISLLRLEIPH